MPISDHLRELRGLVGSRLLLLPAVAAILRDDRGRVLFQRAETGWGLPAGGIEPGESPAEAVVREVYEETGLRVRPERIVGVFGGRAFRVRYPNGDEVEYTAVVFECVVVGGRLEAVDGESLELRWFDVDEAPALPLGLPTDLLVHRSLEARFERPAPGGEP